MSSTQTMHIHPWLTTNPHSFIQTSINSFIQVVHPLRREGAKGLGMGEPRTSIREVEGGGGEEKEQAHKGRANYNNNIH